MVSVPIGPFIHLTPNGPFSSFYIKKKLFWSLDAVEVFGTYGLIA
jgi:hypothetical protein